MLLVFSTYSSSFPAVGPDKQSSGYSKLFLHMPHHVDSAISLPRLPADLFDQWQADSTPFTLAVNTAIPLAGQMMSYETFCESAPDSGHLLIDLFGWSKQQCQSAMLHYKLLKLQNPAVSAHFIVPAVRHIYDHGTYKPPGLIMQTCQQFTRGRRKAHVLYNPPVVRRADMQVCHPQIGWQNKLCAALRGTSS